MDSEFMTPHEAMALLRVGRTTMYARLRAGKIPGAVKVGGQWRIHRVTFYEAHGLVMRA